MGMIFMSNPQVLVPNRYHVVPRTILFVFNGKNVLLQKGALDKKINAGLWNGLGGHVERNEDILTAAKRELHEEAGIICVSPIFCGTILIDVNQTEGIILFVFGCNVGKTDFYDSPEGKLNWFETDQLPKIDIVDDVSMLIAFVKTTMETGKQFHLLYSYDSDGNRITTVN
jgi:8-oxo-dGTP diphosphatase